MKEGIKAGGIKIMRGKPKASGNFYGNTAKKSKVLNISSYLNFYRCLNSDEISAEGRG